MQQVAYTRVHAQQQGLCAANKQAFIFAKIVHLPHIQPNKSLNTIIFGTTFIPVPFSPLNAYLAAKIAHKSNRNC
jgi:hypothetical protein